MKRGLYRLINTFHTPYIMASYVCFDVMHYIEPPSGIRLNVSISKEVRGGGG